MTGQNEIDERLLRYLLGEMTREERREVEEWAARSEENAAYFRRFQRLHLRVSWGMRSELVTTSFGALRRRLTRGRRMWTRAGVAAAVALLLGVGGLLVWEREALPEPSAREVAIVPGRARAVLHLSSGETVAMDTLARELTERDGTAIRVDEDGRVAYEAAGGGETERAPMNRIEVPRGGEFHVTLADGSEVWLNADSELRYPARFTGADRRVWLKGEAYFSVRTDSARPFVVEAEDVRVRVYGTEFNVSTQETGRVETVLVSGSVGMGHGGEEVALRPSEKGTFARESGEMTVEEVDVLPYVAWRTGDFVFKDESLERIMDKLARWYDLEVFFQNADLREVRLSGNLKRFKDVRELFRSFEKISEARFTVNGKTVVIGK